MATYLQADRPMAVFTPLQADALLLVGLRGEEGLSRLFSFRLELLAEDAHKVAFDKLLGNRVTVRLKLLDDRERYWSGICSEVSEIGQGPVFTEYRLEMVPQLWLLTRRAQSRIFQSLTVPDILKKVLTGLDVSWEIRGTFHPRDYCVQYRETDFNFASRLMEEEGIYYFFKHTETSHTMVVSDSPQSHPDMPLGNRVIFDETSRGREDDLRVTRWEKAQSLRSGKVTLWDHSFELPHKHLEAEESIQENVAAGKVTHKLKVGGNDQLEIYDYPGEYAQRFDGVDRGGGDRAGDTQKIFEDNRRTAKIRIQEEAVPGLVIFGSGHCRNFVSGHTFNLERHYNADGAYVLTSVTHSITTSGMDYRSGTGGGFDYRNTFTCIPLGVPFRPPRGTPRPTVPGMQTALVVGPPGDEIFPDKYGRVKVQFHWDREGRGNADSSCWVRVAQSSAGKLWGSIFIPRIGHEVVVAFEEGDPDRPIIVGSVYNAQEMPPYPLPDEKTKTVLFKSNSSKGGGGFNEIRIEDRKGKEQIFIHSERNTDVRIKHDHFETIGGASHHIVGGDHLVKVEGDRHDHVVGDENRQVDSTISRVAGMNVQEKVGINHALEAGMEIHLKAGMNVVIEAGVTLTLKVGGNFININPAGIFLQGTMLMLNSGGAPGVGAGSHPTAPRDPTEADDAKAGKVSEAPPANRPPRPPTYSAAAVVLQRAAQNGTPFCEL
jgi:type VI secretion system secreted protein VgrG